MTQDVTGNVTFTFGETYLPNLADVGAINRARTIVDDQTTGTFNTNTRPTAAEVTILAQQAAGQVADRVGDDLSDLNDSALEGTLIGRGQNIAALYTAALVESGCREPREGLITMWNKLADQRLDSLYSAIKEAAAGGDIGPEDDPGLPIYAFPVRCPLPTVW